MNIHGKIYSIVVVMALTALTIGGISFYSLSELVGRFKIGKTSHLASVAPLTDTRQPQVLMARFSGANALKIDEWQEF